MLGRSTSILQRLVSPGRTPCVQAEIGYVQPCRERPVADAMPLDRRRVEILNMRKAPRPPRLSEEGFALYDHRSRVRDFADLEEVTSVYLAEMEHFMRDVTGSTQVFIRGTTILRSPRHVRDYAAGVKAAPSSPIAHSDYTDRTVWRVAADAMRRHGVECVPEGRLKVYTMWRAIGAPPQDQPLAMCDRRTVEEADLVRADSYGGVGNHGDWQEFYVLRFNPGHRWGYFPDMTRDELLVSQQFDTRAQGSPGCPHVAFRDPTCPADVPARLSIEARAFVICD
jgi:hypothetical protein